MGILLSCDIDISSALQITSGEMHDEDYDNLPVASLWNEQEDILAENRMKVADIMKECREFERSESF
jgi:hypothetical protein